MWGRNGRGRGESFSFFALSVSLLLLPCPFSPFLGSNNITTALHLFFVNSPFPFFLAISGSKNVIKFFPFCCFTSFFPFFVENEDE